MPRRRLSHHAVGVVHGNHSALGYEFSSQAQVASINFDAFRGDGAPHEVHSAEIIQAKKIGHFERRIG